MGCRVDEAGVAVHSVRRSGLVSSVAPTLSSDPRLLPAGAQPQPHTEAGVELEVSQQERHNHLLGAVTNYLSGLISTQTTTSISPILLYRTNVLGKVLNEFRV